MPSEAWCDVMDMAEQGCAHCQARRSPQRAAQLRTQEAGMHDRGGGSAPNRDVRSRSTAWVVLIAEYPGRCGLDCGEPIRVNDEIMRHGPIWAHLECVLSVRSA